MTDHSHIRQIRQEMPAATSRLYFNAGTFGPLPTCVLNAINERLRFEYTHGRLGADAFEQMGLIYGEARQRAARLLNAGESEIALTDNTGEGLNAIIHGFNWHEGDEVITTNHEHFSALAPLYQLRDRYGIVIRFADIGPLADQPALKPIADLVTTRSRLIVMSHVAWTTGAVLNISNVASMGREVGVPVLVDGAQSAGAIPIDVKALDVDFYAIPMQKWLCGPDGTGALYVRRESLGYVSPTYVGYFSAKHEEDVEWALQDTAQRFELGGRQSAAIAGQCAVLQWLEETIGYEWMHSRIASLHRYAYDTLQTVPGLTMLTPIAGASGLLAFRLDGHATEDVVQRLRDDDNIFIRSIPSMQSLRVSTGFYNTEEEIDTLVKALREIQG